MIKHCNSCTNRTAPRNVNRTRRSCSNTPQTAALKTKQIAQWTAWTEMKWLRKGAEYIMVCQRVMVEELKTVKDYGKTGRGLGGINPFPVFAAVAQPSICFIPDWLTSNHLLRYCVCVHVCVSLPGEKWKTPTLKMFRSQTQNCEAMCSRQQLILHFALCFVWDRALHDEKRKANCQAHDAGNDQNGITQPRKILKSLR